MGRALFAGILLCCSIAHADRLVVVASDHELVQALQDLTFEVSEVADRPTPGLAELGGVSRELADAHDATATVWLHGTTLVTYDRAADRYIVRDVPYTLPLDATQAAEIARMVRVMLQAAQQPAPAPAVPVAPRRSVPLRVTERPVGPARAEPVAALFVGGGGWFAAPDASVLPALVLGAAWRPHAFGAALVATLAPRSDIATMSFAGDVHEWTLAAEARYAIGPSAGIQIVPAAGLALYSVTVRGSDLEASRYNPAARVGLSAAVPLGHRIDAGIGVTADCLLRRQRYELGTEQILQVNRLQVQSTAWIGIHL